MSPVAPCTQVGWGVVNMSNVMPIYNHLAGIEEIPSRPGDVVACMNANQDLREAYWNAYPSTPNSGMLSMIGAEGVERRIKQS